MAKNKKKKKHVIGIDLGGTKMLTALMDVRFRILSSTKIKTEVAKGDKHFVNGIVESVRQVMDEFIYSFITRQASKRSDSQCQATFMDEAIKNGGARCDGGSLERSSHNTNVPNLQSRG